MKFWLELGIVKYSCNFHLKVMYRYAGHGGGEEYLNNQTFSSLNKVPVALLFGCSSGQLKANGEFDPYGIVLTYLNKGCPAVVGNLWDVTDIDFDRFSIKFLQNWGLFTPSKSKYYSICESLAMSRDECKLKYLVGAAPVVYGLPVHLQK
ncbi:peptidase family C50-domain-containing protein [Globomyces pollinis-pini]|nr:peptidase family C50-domain-containing protein [Globomyces pollinis-pini]